MPESIFKSLPDPPEAANGIGVLTRMIDAVGFRYYWSTEGLRPEDFEFRACDGAMSLAEVLKHTFFLADRVNACLGGAAPEGAGDAKAPEEIRAATLGHLQAAREAAQKLNDASLVDRKMEIREGMVFPFWNMVNGPLADALTHIGQINVWRRQSGNPTPKANPLVGRPPKE